MQVTPAHIGFIVDGNRRWASGRGLKPYEGHIAGRKALREVLLEVFDRGIKWASIYVFSAENWKRNPLEVAKLMDFVVQALQDDLAVFSEKNIRMVVVGRRGLPLPKKVLSTIRHAEAQTANNTAGTIVICLNYGGQQEIADAAAAMIREGVQHDEVTPELMSQYMYAPDVPPCDLVVRTSGEQRLSNFMLWRAAYSEFIFLDNLWPDMTKQDVSDILDEYARRNRRFGG